MCFTVNVNIVKEELEKRYGAVLNDPDAYRPSYYYHAFELPRLPVITAERPEKIQLFYWGLIPSWTNSEKQASEIRLKTFNARAETLSRKPSFSKPLRSKRCLVPVRGFYEWQHRKDRKIPHYVYLADQDIFSLAGIYDTWLDKSTGELTYSFSIITVAANPLLAKIHNSKQRMPAILTGEDEKSWLSITFPKDRVQGLLQPYPEQEIKAHTISPLISKKGVEKNLPRLIEPFNYDQSRFFLE